jgi:short-subunit dehydrogenase
VDRTVIAPNGGRVQRKPGLMPALDVAVDVSLFESRRRNVVRYRRVVDSSGFHRLSPSTRQSASYAIFCLKVISDQHRVQRLAGGVSLSDEREDPCQGGLLRQCKRLQNGESMKNLKGRTALLTGASGGIGVHIAQALASEGMNLILAARSTDKLETVADELRATGCSVLCVPTDLNDRASVVALTERAEGEGGGVDLLVNNAVLELVKPFEEFPIETIDQMIETNLRAPIVLSRLLLPKMLERGRGHIVSVSSVAGMAGVPYWEAYCATKAGLVGFTRSFRTTALGAGSPVGASVVCPGFVKAGMYERMTGEFDVRAPLVFGTSSPQSVARAVVRAAKRNAPEIIVTPGPIRPLLALAVFAPRFIQWLVNKVGTLRFFGTVAGLGSRYR